jgi:hypothetical protein
MNWERWKFAAAMTLGTAMIPAGVIFAAWFAQLPPQQSRVVSVVILVACLILMTFASKARRER